MRKLLGFTALLVFLMVLAILLSIMDIIDLRGIVGFSRSSTSILQVLRSESLMFLATDRVTTYIYTDICDNSLIMGNREGVLIMKVTYLFGLDLSVLTVDSIQQTSGGYIIHLPDLELLEMSPDLTTAELYTKTSGLVWLHDRISGYDMHEALLSQMDSVATEFLFSEGLLPERSEIVSRLNGFAPVLSEYAGADVVFQ
ncbi:MAG: hypothetical protein AVO35_10495 [Candidatus Aegiribacteria sp. MLS_C]|nr:MAG: hypothetical protein AVO35_10495 [Candidatus Aegiribacteria sp. MLS_C]